MGEEKRQTGFGSSYRKGNGQDLGTRSEIGTVLGGQVWMVKPDKDAKTANPCVWMQAGIVEFKNCNNFYDCTTCKYDLGSVDYNDMVTDVDMRGVLGLVLAPQYARHAAR